VATYQNNALQGYCNVTVKGGLSGGDAVLEMARRVGRTLEGLQIDTLLIEVQNPRGMNERMGKQALMDLHAVCYSVAAVVGDQSTHTIFYHPSAWNGGVPKKITHDRMRTKYGIAPAMQEDYLCAIGMIDYYIGAKHGRNRFRRG